MFWGEILYEEENLVVDQLSISEMIAVIAHQVWTN